MGNYVFHMVLENNWNVLENLAAVDAFRIWDKTSWKVQANRVPLPPLELICMANCKCSQVCMSAWSPICEPVAIYCPSWVCLPTDNVTGIMHLVARREELCSDITWRSHHGEVSCPTGEWCCSTVTNDQCTTWLMQSGPGSVWFMQIISSSWVVACMSR